MRPARDIRLAFGLLTGMPVRAGLPAGGQPTNVAAWFPLVGAVVGAIPASALIGLVRLSDRVGDGLFEQRAAYLLGALVVAFWAWVTRMLHWDGLGDVADAVWGGDSPARRLEIMADPRVGGFGAAAITFVGLVEVTAVATLVAGGTGWVWVLLSAPATARLSATFAAALGRPARDVGLGRSVSVPAGGATLALGVAGMTAAMAWAPAFAWALGDTLLSSGGGWTILAIAAAATIVAALVPHALARFFGGVTGDVMGASIVLTETATLALAALLGVW